MIFTVTCLCTYFLKLLFEAILSLYSSCVSASLLDYSGFTSVWMGIGRGAKPGKGNLSSESANATPNLLG